MGDDEGPPKWLPASVGRAGRKAQPSDAQALRDGSAWEALAASLDTAVEHLHSDKLPEELRGDGTGYRHVLMLMALGIDEALRSSDPYDPSITPGNVDAVMRWGMDCPDAAYSGATIRGDATYVVRGTRGSARYVGLQVMSGIEATANAVVDELEVAADGSFEIVLSADEHAGNWMPLHEATSALVVRQFFYDWENEEPARLSISCTSSPPRDDTSPSSRAGADAQVGAQLVALGEFVEESLRFWWDIEEAGRSQGLNVFRPPQARTEMGGAAENVTVWGSWELADDEAMIIEVTPPEAMYWSISFGDHWWKTIDYAEHQSSLNGFQASLDDDGVMRAVVAHRDPGVANWLDTAGHRRGPAIVRYVRAADAPVPRTEIVPFVRIDDVVPATTRRITAPERAAVLAGRRAGVRRRFGR